ncbi:MAG: hypothetical protein ABJC62_05055 [Frankiaceae bacterium]
MPEVSSDLGCGGLGRRWRNNPRAVIRGLNGRSKARRVLTEDDAGQ